MLEELAKGRVVDELAAFLRENRGSIVKMVTINEMGRDTRGYSPRGVVLEIVDFEKLCKAIDQFGAKLRRREREASRGLR